MKIISIWQPWSIIDQTAFKKYSTSWLEGYLPWWYVGCQGGTGNWKYVLNETTSGKTFECRVRMENCHDAVLPGMRQFCWATQKLLPIILLQVQGQAGKNAFKADLRIIMQLFLTQFTDPWIVGTDLNLVVWLRNDCVFLVIAWRLKTVWKVVKIPYLIIED